MAPSRNHQPSGRTSSAKHTSADTHLLVKKADFTAVVLEAAVEPSKDVGQLEEKEKISVRIANGQSIRPYGTGYFILENSERIPVFLFKELTGFLLLVGQIVDAIDGRAAFESSHYNYLQVLFSCTIRRLYLS